MTAKLTDHERVAAGAVQRRAAGHRAGRFGGLGFFSDFGPRGRACGAS